MSKISGGCLCGKIRYEISGPVDDLVVCHCANCRRQSGSAFSSNLVVPCDAVDLVGVTAVYRDQGDSGQAVYRHFCGNCGSPIFSALELMPEISIFKAGTIDESAAFKIGSECYCDSAVAWGPACNAPVRFAKAPA